MKRSSLKSRRVVAMLGFLILSASAFCPEAWGQAVPAVPARAATFRQVEVDQLGRLVTEVFWRTAAGERFRRIERRLPSGSLDPSFAASGGVNVREGKGFLVNTAGDVFLGVKSCGGGGPAVIRLDGEGRKDSRFGVGGCSRVDFLPRSLAMAADGSLFVAGLKRYCPCGKDAIFKREAVVSKLSQRGRPNRGFGDVQLRGFVPSQSASPGPVAIAAAKNGGVFIDIGRLTLKFGRLGQQVMRYGSGGIARLRNSHESIRPVAAFALPEGRVLSVLVASGPFSEHTPEVVVTRLNSAGRPDASFGERGIVGLPLGIDANAESPVALTSDGGIVISASSRETTPVLLGLDSNGGMDPAFGSGGIAPVMGSPELSIRSLAVAPNSSVRLAGSEAGAVLLGRTADGMPDESFGTDGRIFDPHFESPPR